MQRCSIEPCTVTRRGEEKLCCGLLRKNDARTCGGKMEVDGKGRRRKKWQHIGKEERRRPRRGETLTFLKGSSVIKSHRVCMKVGRKAELPVLHCESTEIWEVHVHRPSGSVSFSTSMMQHLKKLGTGTTGKNRQWA